jgi:hypothetical protein
VVVQREGGRAAAAPVPAQVRRDDPAVPGQLGHLVELERGVHRDAVQQQYRIARPGLGDVQVDPVQRHQPR